jgi:hypothetical protein
MKETINAQQITFPATQPFNGYRLFKTIALALLIRLSLAG